MADPIIPLLGTYYKKMHEVSCVRMITVMLLITVNISKLLKSGCTL